MASIHLVKEEETAPVIVLRASTSPWTAWTYIAVSPLLLAMIRTWLVWFSAFVQRNVHEEDIRAACRRPMPDEAERCFDTVVIQREGIRR